MPADAPQLASLARMREHATVTVEWPIVTLRARGTPDRETVEALFVLTDELFELEERFAMVFDFTELDGMPSATVRQLAADYQKRNEARFRRWVAADASVITNPIARGMMTAIHWLSKPSHPERAFASLEDALAWARAELAKPG